MGNDLLTIRDVVASLPALQGRPIARQTVWRWMTRDVDPLPSFWIGRRRVTTRADLTSFLTRQGGRQASALVRAHKARNQLKAKYGF
jgi:hypothetical protein